MDFITRAELSTLHTPPAGPCVSVMIPTHRVRSQEDEIRWKKQLGEAERLLNEHGIKGGNTQTFLEEGRAKLSDSVFWDHQSDGLVGYFAPGFARMYRVPLALPELTVAGPRFHVKPLLPVLQRDGRFFLLTLSENSVRLYQGNGFGLDEIDLKGVPESLAEALKYDEKLSQLQVHTQPATGAGRGPGLGGQGMFHGHGVGTDDEKNDRLRYFRQIDRGLHDYLREESAPLVLAGVSEHWPIYRSANTYPHLLDEGVPGNVDRVNTNDLHRKAWTVVREAMPDVRRQDLDRFGHESGASHGRTSTDLETVVTAAADRRVEVLFVAQGVTCWGRWDSAERRLDTHDTRRPDSEDLLSVAALETLANDGAVHVVPPKEVPGGGPVAAVFRWPA